MSGAVDDGSGPVLDESVLAELEERLGAGEVAIFAGMFRAHAATLLAVLGQADPRRIVRETHSMASTAGALGLTRLLAACHALEQGAHDRLDSVPGLAGEVRRATEAALAAMAARCPPAD